jgi:O-antigen ligase
MSSHNQFLRIWVEIGAIGLSIFLFWIAYCVYIFRKHKDLAGNTLVLIMCISMLTDDMGQIQAGIVFFVFFITLRFAYIHTQHNNLSHHEHSII